MQSASPAALVIIGHVDGRAQVSVDMFEPFVAAESQACRELCGRADLIFVNEAEYRGLYDGRPHPPVPVIRKYGP